MESKDEKTEPKDEDADDTAVKEDPDDDGESDGREESREEADIRDIRYKLEILILKASIFPKKGIPTNPWNAFSHLKNLEENKTNPAPHPVLSAATIRKDLSAKERNLSVRNITFVFSKAF